MDSLKILAPAKVNIVLRVLGLRPDGYHDLQMVMVPLSLADELEITKTPKNIEFFLDGAGDNGMIGEKNLAYRAAAALKEAAQVNFGAKIKLTKNVPIAAGLGGGSSDAAAVLKGLNKVWGLNWAPEMLAEIGQKLGADVPFFCYDGPAFVEGTGEKIDVYHEFPELSLLLINPGFPVPTPWVYKQWDLQLTVKADNARYRPLFKGFADLISSLQNDLEAVTIPAYPEIFEIKQALINEGASAAMMSGSGPTVFGVFETKNLRDRAKKAKFKENWRVFAADSI